MQCISFYKHIVMVLFIGMLHAAQEDIEFYTDRDPKFREITERWLHEWDIPYNELIFRKDV